MVGSGFKLKYSLKRRRAESTRLRKEYPARIPVIVEKDQGSGIPDIDMDKYIIPADLTVDQFAYVIRKRIELRAEKKLFIYIKDNLPPKSASMSEIYEVNKDEDGFLYVTYSGNDPYSRVSSSECGCFGAPILLGFIMILIFISLN